MKKIFLGLLICFAVVNIANAGTTDWSYNDYSHGSYVPKSGSFAEWAGNGLYVSWINFQLDQHNVNNITDYNNGGNNPGSSCDNAKAYLTLDMTAVPDGWDLEIDAYYITTNFPNPKKDLEDNNWFGENDESEVVALGTVQKNKAYYMRTYWYDNRDGGRNDGGNIQGQFAMSKKGWWDYNNCTQSNVIQIINHYGKNHGSL